MDLEVIGKYLPRLASGLWWTLSVTAAASVISIAIGLIVAMLHATRWRAISVLLRTYVEFMRGMPILVLLFLLYYAGPSFGLRLDAVTVGVVGLGIYGGAYFAEVFRSGLVNVNPGQIEAARMLGLSRSQILRRVELPQMFATVLPSVINQMIMLVKESAVLSVITVPELTSETTRIVTESFRVTEPFLAMALAYWLLIETIARVGRAAERRIRRYL